MKELRCPVCKGDFIKINGSLKCKNNHSFDISSEGYVNLLLSSQMHTKAPGDNKPMVAARRRFLEKGYYLPLSDEINKNLGEMLLAKKLNNPTIIDAGCGEGYYTSRAYRHLQDIGVNGKLIGFDISKFALAAAAKKNKDIAHGVASLFSMPVDDEAADCVINLFAPLCREEFLRVLKSKGLLFIVAPGKKHLWGLKSELYEKPYENELSSLELAGFSFLKQVSLSYDVEFLSNQEVLDVFSMTPYYWKTSKEAAERLKDLASLKTKLEFEILIYEKD